jgi:hypothetical protein
LSGLLDDPSAVTFTIGNRTAGDRGYMGLMGDVGVAAYAMNTNTLTAIFQATRSRYGK